jgi:hypothetical protein
VDALANTEVEELLARIGCPNGRLSTDRDIAYLRWRYVGAPTLDYMGVRYEEEGELRGLAIFRIRRRGALTEASVVDLLAPRDDSVTARRLLRRVARASDVDHVACHVPQGSTFARAAMGAGFFRTPVGITVITNPLIGDLRPDPTLIGSWALSLGDLEVF